METDQLHYATTRMRMMNLLLKEIFRWILV